MSPPVDSTVTFTLQPSQVAFLTNKLDEYRAMGAAVKKQGYAHRMAQHLKKEMNAMGATNMSQAREDQLKLAVERFFEERKYERSPTKRKWGIKWHARLVFKYVRTRAIWHLAKLILANLPLPDLRRLLDDEDAVIKEDLGSTPEEKIELPEDFDEEDDDHESEPPAPANGRVPTPFWKFPHATTLLWSVLTEKEKNHYEHLADEWRSEGPPQEEKRKLVQTKLGPRCQDFATSVYNDMGVIVFFLLGYEDSTLERFGVTLEYNTELTGKQAFLQRYQKQWVASGIQDRWCEYVGNVLASDDETDPAAATKKAGKRARRPLLPMKSDASGQPILPPLSAMPETEQRSVWLGDVLRSFFTRIYNLDLGNKPLPAVISAEKDSLRVRVPWKSIKGRARSCVTAEFLPDEFVEKFEDPSQWSLKTRRAVYDFYYARQEDPNVKTTFQFTSIPVKKRNHLNKEVVVFVPNRRHLCELVTSDDESEDEQHQRRPPSPKKKKKAVSFRQVPSPQVSGSSSESEYSFGEDSEQVPETQVIHPPSPSSSIALADTLSSSDSEYDFDDSADVQPLATLHSSSDSEYDFDSPAQAAQPLPSETPSDSEEYDFPGTPEPELPPAAESSDEEPLHVQLLGSRPPSQPPPQTELEESASDTEDELPTVDEPRRPPKRRRLEVDPVDEATLKTPRQTRSGAAKSAGEKGKAADAKPSRQGGRGGATRARSGGARGRGRVAKGQ
ncbi:hypothetical protein CC1G_13284 [Coprinopsis cinerea okayama7|uniref:Uncharacterized protein n=1 Tax=Coprinopsis cinerea (strain Okayama-7 / 130 / ATCC MYA-4618 / FGSC 9003) TaxID=240176 RepID=A8PIB5_COPC7|nr:hypothetical protein CC1G_13284 [Coprinopsis cinerea okayama7\|eukprot:XP_001841546.1 hypothetical protein CC1G_13284 [Coprinopsis cinerea okayama7\